MILIKVTVFDKVNLKLMLIKKKIKMLVFKILISTFVSYVGAKVDTQRPPS